MPLSHPRFHGLWLPLISPFRDGRLDEPSFRRLVNRYAGRVDGFVLAASTGEGLALSRDETRHLAEWASEELEAAGKNTPVIIGLCGASTAAVAEALREAAEWPADGFLVACPYYVRPSQEGLRRHFEALADASQANLLIYNIPYRTGVNLENDTLFRLAERTNIVGIKDCCAIPRQSLELAQRKPAGFSALTGEDASFLSALQQGADGGITASAHLDPEGFQAVLGHAREGAWTDAEGVWHGLAQIADLLFAEPSPAALKHCLWRLGVIDSAELRLPMTPVSPGLGGRLDRLLRRPSAP
jgi:4-hydroxy-tetrahydrodipicolinate synthase